MCIWAVLVLLVLVWEGVIHLILHGVMMICRLFRQMIGKGSHITIFPNNSLSTIHHCRTNNLTKIRGIGDTISRNFHLAFGGTGICELVYLFFFTQRTMLTTIHIYNRDEKSTFITCFLFVCLSTLCIN